jgi:hypothetical protein
MSYPHGDEGDIRRPDFVRGTHEVLLGRPTVRNTSGGKETVGPPWREQLAQVAASSRRPRDVRAGLSPPIGEVQLASDPAARPEAPGVVVAGGLGGAGLGLSQRCRGTRLRLLRIRPGLRSPVRRAATRQMRGRRLRAWRRGVLAGLFGGQGGVEPPTFRFSGVTSALFTVSMPRSDSGRRTPTVAGGGCRCRHRGCQPGRRASGARRPDTCCSIHPPVVA